MFNLENILSNLSNAAVLEITSGRYEYKSVSFKFPTNDLDEHYSISSSGVGFFIKWDGMDMIKEDFRISKDYFTILYKECIKELSKRI